jgi:hypothetical protein
MYIRETFATTIEERIEPVVKVADRQPVTVLNEITNLVVTPQWERHLRTMLDAYAENFDREDEHEIGFWISGFFGSGKSLLMKIFGLLLQGGELATPEHASVHQLFLNRVPADSPERGDIERALAVCRNRVATSLVGGNLHAKLANSNDSLALVVFKLFAEERGYTNNWSFAWTIEYQLDVRGYTEEFRQRVCDRCGQDWRSVVDDSDFYSEDLQFVAAELLSNNFSSPAAVQNAVTQTYYNGITPDMLLRRLLRWCQSQDEGSRRHKLLLQLDELGQWINSGVNVTSRLMEVQILVETAALVGQGRLWIAVTAHGDVQALRENVQQELYAKINQRFDIQCRLSNEDIYEVVQKRLLRKNQAANVQLRQRFEERKGELTDMGSLMNASRVYPKPMADNFADFYPYLPWTVSVIPNVIKNIAQATGRDEALTGSNRTMMGVVQSGILETDNILRKPIGALISLADLYPQLSSDAPIETRTDMNRILENVKDATDFTVKVAYALYLLGQDEYIPCSLQNVTLAVVDSTEANLGTLRPRIKTELDRLVHADYAKQVGEIYTFLSTQQRGFQDKVHRRENELASKVFDLSLKLKEGYGSYDALRFEDVSLGQGLRKLVKIELDGSPLRTQGYVTVRVYSPLQYVLDPDLANDTVLKQRSTQEPDTIYLRMSNVKELRRALVHAVATEEVADEILARSLNTDPEYEVARQEKQHDLVEYRNEVHKALDEAVRNASVFMRGSSYNLIDGANASEAVRNTLSYLLKAIYARFSELSYRVLNEESAVKAALNDNIAHPDLKALSVFTAQGELNTSNALISTLKGLLPQEGNDQGWMNADELRIALEKPPYGWDGNAVKVGLALLLRASQCRLMDNGVVLTDPQSAAVLQVLTKAQRFKSLRVQGVHSDLNTTELLEIRGAFQAAFGHKPAIVASTLNRALGEELARLQEETQSLRDWSKMTSCSFPTIFEKGDSLVLGLSSSTTPGVRLPHFLREIDTILDHIKLLENLTRFKNEYGHLYTQLRDFFNSMTNAESVPSEVRTFLNDWKVVVQNQEVTDPVRWNELLQAYHQAQQAIADQIARWQQDVLNGVSELEQTVPQQLTTAGVPAEHVAEEAAQLVANGQGLRTRAEQANLHFGEARRLYADLLGLRMQLPNQIREAARKYEATSTPPPTPPGPGNGDVETPPVQPEIYLYWQQALGKVRISSPADLEEVIDRLRRQVTTELAQSRIVIIE